MKAAMLVALYDPEDLMVLEVSVADRVALQRLCQATVSESLNRCLGFWDT